MHLAVLLLVLLPFAQCEPEPLNLELDLVANVDHQCEQSIPPPTERNTAPHADSNIEIELIILDLLGIEAELGASEPDTAEPDPGPDCTPITSVAPPCPPLPDKCMAERAVLLDHPDDAQEPRPTTAPEIAVQPQAGIDTEKNPDKSSKGEDDKPVRSPPEECTLVTDDLDLHSPDLDVSQRDGVTGDYLPTAKRHAHQAHNKTHGTRVPDNHSPGPHAQSISGGCKSDEMRCARGGTCLANTVKCCKGGELSSQWSLTGWSTSLTLQPAHLPYITLHLPSFIPAISPARVLTSRKDVLPAVLLLHQ